MARNKLAYNEHCILKHTTYVGGVVVLGFLSGILFAAPKAPVTAAESFAHPFYVGAAGGAGSTTWEGLVPTKTNQNLAMNLSTPTTVNEGGGVYGFFGGYEFGPYFAIEASYMHYPSAHVYFDEVSLFSFMNDGLTAFTTKTETVNVMAKIMLIIPHTLIRAYSSAGAAEVHRNDILADHWHLNPTFGLGLNYNFTPHLMGELAANYTAGYGEAQLNPTDVYFPFLYSGFLRLAYRL